MSRLSDNIAALREPEFLKLFLGQAASVVGVMFTVVALPFAVLSDRRQRHGHRHRGGGQPRAAGGLPAGRRRVGRPAAPPAGHARRRLPARGAAAHGRRAARERLRRRSGTSPCSRSRWAGPKRSSAPPTPGSSRRSSARAACSRPTRCRASSRAASVTLGAVTAGLAGGCPRPRLGDRHRRRSRYIVSAAFLLRLRPAAFLGRPPPARRTAHPSPSAPHVDAIADPPLVAPAAGRPSSARRSSPTLRPAGASSPATPGCG